MTSNIKRALNASKTALMIVIIHNGINSIRALEFDSLDCLKYLVPCFATCFCQLHLSFLCKHSLFDYNICIELTKMCF